MWKQIIQFTKGPRKVLRKILALNDSAHAIALGVAIGVFVGLTPTVGIQTLLILGLVVCFRKIMYFNATAAMASTYISNPITVVPMYYGWYRIGAWFTSGSLTAAEFEQMLQFDGLAGWWDAMCTLGAQVAVPMCIGALLTAPIGVAIAYPATYFLVKWVRDQRRSIKEGVPEQSEASGTEGHAMTTSERSDGERSDNERSDSDGTSGDQRVDSANAGPNPPDRSSSNSRTSDSKPLLSS